MIKNTIHVQLILPSKGLKSLTTTTTWTAHNIEPLREGDENMGKAFMKRQMSVFSLNMIITKLMETCWSTL